jgi:hypothetical protein
MQTDQDTDTFPRDITLDPEFVDQQIDRMLGWEILNRYLNHQVNIPMQPLELCDKIGVNKGYVHQVIKTVKQKLNAE